MNTACIIAACVANSHSRNKQNINCNNDLLENTYYKVTFEKYYYFKSVSIYIPEVAICSAFSTMEQLLTTSTTFKIVRVPESTLAASHSFWISSSECRAGITKYIQDNLDSIMSYPIWQVYDEQVLHNYKAMLNKKYSIDVNSMSFEYTTKFFWEHNIEKS